MPIAAIGATAAKDCNVPRSVSSTSIELCACSECAVSGLRPQHMDLPMNREWADKTCQINIIERIRIPKIGHKLMF